MRLQDGEAAGHSRSIGEHPDRREEFGSPLDLIEDHESVQGLECQERVGQTRPEEADDGVASQTPSKLEEVSGARNHGCGVSLKFRRWYPDFHENAGWWRPANGLRPSVVRLIRARRSAAGRG